MLATDIATVAADENYEVISLSHEELDVTQPWQVRQAVEGYTPDVVIYTPGIGVDLCEAQPAEGYRIHTWGAGVVARACQRSGAICIYISTCGLFSDEVRHHSEYEPVQLKTQYARSKFLGENLTLQSCERSFVVRPGWLFGGTPDHRRNFVYQRYLEAKREPVLRSANDKFGCPTYTVDLAAKMMELISTDEYGMYHVTNQGKASRYDYVKCIVEAFGLETPVEPVDSSTFPRAAPVPDCELLENLNLRFLGVEPMAPWQDAILRYAQSLEVKL